MSKRRSTPFTNEETDTTTDVEMFEKLLVVESTEMKDVVFGSTSVTIPADSMHTFDAKRNKVKWHVFVHGEIARCLISMRATSFGWLQLKPNRGRHEHSRSH